MTAAQQPDLFGEFDAQAAEIEQQRERRAAWSARFARVKVSIAYESAGGNKPGDVLDGIACPSCGGVEFNAYLLSINHGWDAGVPGYGPFEGRCNKQRHLDAGRTDISLDGVGVVRLEDQP